VAHRLLILVGLIQIDRFLGNKADRIGSIRLVNAPRRARESKKGSTGGVNESTRFVNTPSRARESKRGLTLRGLTKSNWLSAPKSGKHGKGCYLDVNHAKKPLTNPVQIGLRPIFAYGALRQV
jgi:hypothetical protein